MLGVALLACVESGNTSLQHVANPTDSPATARGVCKPHYYASAYVDLDLTHHLEFHCDRSDSYSCRYRQRPERCNDGCEGRVDDNG